MFTRISSILQENEKLTEILLFILVVLIVVYKSLKLFIKKNWVIYYNFKVYIKQCYLIIWSVEKIQKIKIQKLQR